MPGIGPGIHVFTPAVTWTAGTSPAMTLSLIRELLLPRQLALAAGIFAIIPFNELAVLHHVLCDDRNGILAVIVKGNFADD